MANPISPPTHCVALGDLERRNTGIENPLLDLPAEILNAITGYVATGATPQAAAINAIWWGRVSVLAHLATHESPAASAINHAKHLKALDEALVIMWRHIEPGLTTAEEIRCWIANPDNMHILNSISTIGLEKHELKAIPLEINTFPVLSSLHLDYNQITQINPNTFAGCPNLHTLHLHNNKIAAIAPQAFAGCRALCILRLHHNQIAQINPNTFAGCPNLRDLYLDNNKIAAIAPQTFAGCPHLRTLHLNNNKIAAIAPQAFAGCPHLQCLYLDNNKIAEIAPQTFAGYRALYMLRLNYNQIVQIDRQAFAGCGALEHLWLHHNQIAQIHPEVFASCLTWTCLYLGNNPLLCNLDVNDNNTNFYIRFDAFSSYVCRSELAAFYQALSEGKLSTSEVVACLRQLEERDLIYEMVYWEAKAAAEKEGRAFEDSGDLQWGEHHVCDNMPIFYRALKRAVQEKFDRLSADQKNAVYDRIDVIAREDGDEDSPRTSVWNALRFIDAMAGV